MASGKLSNSRFSDDVILFTNPIKRMLKEIQQKPQCNRDTYLIFDPKIKIQDHPFMQQVDHFTVKHQDFQIVCSKSILMWLLWK